ncbi:unnamed protein product [Prunus armeniaca]|uniref:EDS1 EP domain-containing protein n=1 Tax=Prunus armeniaca TaxID=36596 RepID=A0A6J5XBF4_PRUAR|nr:unnamed protein product [Prunus armeniaca]
MEEMKKEMTKLEDHRALCEHSRRYYDAFKISNDTRDSDPNVSWFLLAGIWDEIIEMLRKYELPDEFEAIKKLIQLGTRYRHLVEPLDIANYYRHSRGELTRRYMKKGGRPKRYKYTQRWLEHYQKLQIGTCGESCFWAEVEELLKQTHSAEAIYGERDRVLELQRNLGKWIKDGEVGSKYVLLEQSTFVKLWNKLPSQLKSEPIIGLMKEQTSIANVVVS